MTLSVAASILYATLAALPASVQLGLVAGAPWGCLTLGGLWPGRLPVWLRVIALLQAGMLICMAAAVLNRSGAVALDWPLWSYPVVLTVTGLSLLANAVTPSRIERLTWVPVILLMLISAIVANP